MRKMKKIIILLVIITAILITGILFKDNLILDSFGGEEQRIYLKEQGQVSVNTNFEILVDRETGIMYLYAKGLRKGGLTVMLDRDGKPLIDKGDEQ